LIKFVEIFTIMEIETNNKIAEILKLSDEINTEEKEMLIYFLFQKFNKNIPSVQEIKVNNSVGYFFLPETKKIEKAETETRKLGLWEGKIKYIAPDFNEPLEELSEYM